MSAIKLLLDQNISYRLVRSLREIIPELTHVKFEGLLNAEDSEIWEFARVNHCTIVTFDADFNELQMIKGFPPKVIWLRFGNMTRLEFVNFFQQNISVIKEFLTSNDFEGVGCLEFK